MKHSPAVLVAGIAVLCLAAWRAAQPPVPTYLVVRLDQTFEEVVKNSTYPVRERSNHPSEDPGTTNAGATWVYEPSVIIKYSDPVNGFSLPPTKFASVLYMHNHVQSIATSPMLEALPYEDAVTLLQELQGRFKSSGWMPWDGDHSEWFDLSQQGRKALQDVMFESRLSRSITLVVPGKNLEMTLRLKCEEMCDERQRSLWLIDIGVGHKSLLRGNGG